MKNSVFWFRKGLRLHDNPGLIRAAAMAKPNLYCVFVLDPWFTKSGMVGPNRFNFLLESLADLDQNLRELGSRLIVLKGKPEEVFREVFPTWKVSQLCFERDTEPYAIKRDALVSKMAQELGVEVFSPCTHSLYDPDAIISKTPLGKAPTTYASFMKAIKQLGHPPKIAEKPVALPAFVDDQLSFLEEHKELAWPGAEVPSMADIGLIKPEGRELTPFRGGETAGLKTMKAYLKETEKVCSFEKPKTIPSSVKPETTTLSPYLKFGCVSPRQFYWELNDVLKGKKHTQPPVSLLGQLFWREFYITVAYDTENYDKMVGNPICRQIPWESDEKVDYEMRLTRWKNAQTGFPWIDAAMTQLREQGWIHHLARHAVACFLTRGDLWVSWEKGAQVFDYYLVDADYALNNGNWMWLSASAFFHQFARVYSPISFQQKKDPEGKYIKHFLPKLAKVPKKYIYSPWKMSKAEQKLYGVIIGEDYPEPMVDHETAKKYNLNLMAIAYKAAREAKANGNAKKTKKASASSKTKKTVGKRKAGKKQAGAMDAFVTKKRKS